MALRYSGPAVLHTEGRTFDVEAALATDVGNGVYSWGGRLSASDIAALRLEKQGGTLTLSVPGDPSGDVHVVVADPDPAGGVLLRVHGVGRAPYEQDGDIVTTRGEDGATVYQVAEEVEQ